MIKGRRVPSATAAPATSCAQESHLRRRAVSSAMQLLAVLLQLRAVCRAAPQLLRPPVPRPVPLTVAGPALPGPAEPPFRARARNPALPGPEEGSLLKDRRQVVGERDSGAAEPEPGPGGWTDTANPAAPQGGREAACGVALGGRGTCPPPPHGARASWQRGAGLRSPGGWQTRRERPSVMGARAHRLFHTK